jgi:nucleotide-binding universal stress UspA family protein
MENFLVPVDFSDASASALKYAFELNKYFFARLHVMHIFDVPFAAATETDAGFFQYEALKKAHEDNTWDFINLHKGEYHYDMEVAVTSGGHYQSIANYAKEKNIKLIVLGNKGKGGLRKWFFGSVTQYLLRHAPCPVIAIPPDYAWKEIENMVVCTDLSQPLSDHQCLELKKIADGCKAKLHFLHVQDKIEVALPSDNVAIDKIRSVFGVSPATIAFEHSIGASVNKYLTQCGGELVITLPHYHSWLDNMLLGSETSALSKLVKAPMMSMP